MLPAYTDSRAFRDAFPECVAYGFFPQRERNLYEMWPLVSLLALVWPLALLFHLLFYWSKSRHERMIQKEMGSELELEKIRLQIELERARQGLPLEKLKRYYALTDDAELIEDDEHYNVNRLSL